jgi:hypothetical protein
MQADKNAKREEELQRKKEREALEVFCFLCFSLIFFHLSKRVPELQRIKRSARSS